MPKALRPRRAIRPIAVFALVLTTLSAPLALLLDAREREPNGVYAERRAHLVAQLSAPVLLFGYTGRENSKTVGERTQARIYGDLVRFVECDPAVTELNLFHLGDEKDLGRFQSGLVHADGSHRPSYDAVKAAIAETRGLCTGTSVAWRHSTAVAGASADFGRRAHGRLGFAVTAQEAASVRAGIFRVGSSRGLSERDREWVAAALASNMATPGLVSRASGGARAYWRTDMTFGARSLSTGWYAYAVRFAASTNSGRTSLLVGRPFHVG